MHVQQFIPARTPFLNSTNELHPSAANYCTPAQCEGQGQLAAVCDAFRGPFGEHLARARGQGIAALAMEESSWWANRASAPLHHDSQSLEAGVSWSEGVCPG